MCARESLVTRTSERLSVGRERVCVCDENVVEADGVGRGRVHARKTEACKENVLESPGVGMRMLNSQM